MGRLSDLKAEIEVYCPEIVEMYQKLTLLFSAYDEAGKRVDRTLEVSAVLETRGREVCDLLDGYLSIKKNPEFFNNSNVRLTQTRKTLKAIYQGLVENLRQMNDEHLRDFEISQRLLASRYDVSAQTDDYDNHLGETLEIDNRAIRLVDVLREELIEGSRVKIAAATFSMFA